MPDETEGLTAGPKLWARLAAPVRPGAISWRQDGKPVARNNQHVARFVAYIDAQTVRERLDAVVPGEWDLTLKVLPPLAAVAHGEENDTPCAFKARLRILGVIREDVGVGRDYKQAATDAFKRAAVRFGIGHELYDYEQNWVQLDGDGKYAKPVEDPGAAYARRHGGGRGERDTQGEAARGAAVHPAAAPPAGPAKPAAAPGGNGNGESADAPNCPKCGGKVWDNRLTKRNPKEPDFRCRDHSCDGVIWPPRNTKDTPMVERAKAELAEAGEYPSDWDEVM